MLTMHQAQQQRRRRSPPSLKQQYQEFILQRIEAFKNSLERGVLLNIGHEAATELQNSAGGQFLLTEVLLEDTVDQMIRRRLRLPSFKRWCGQFRGRRQAQRELTHWGIDARSPITEVLPCIEPGDSALVIGAGGEPFACLLTAHEMDVTFLADELACVERVENRIGFESLGSEFTALMADITQWLPPLAREQHLVVIDVAVLDRAPQARRQPLLERIQGLTGPGGLHLLVPCPDALAPDAFLTCYPDWPRPGGRVSRSRGAKSHGLLLSKPACVPDTPSDVSETHGTQAARG
jgi:hypothetical protein